MWLIPCVFTVAGLLNPHIQPAKPEASPKKAETETPEAQYALGLAFQKGNGQKKDFSSAFQCFKKAAAQGHVKAQFSLATCYDDGEGVARDAAQAFFWFRKAAESGHAESQWNLGKCYHTGSGVAQNFKLAEEWYQKSAKQNYPEAFMGLSMMHHEAEGLPRNLVKSYAYLCLAADKGSEMAKKIRPLAEMELTPSEKEAAKKLRQELNASVKN